MRGPPKGFVQQISELFGIACRKSRCPRFSRGENFLLNPHVHHRATPTLPRQQERPQRGRFVALASCRNKKSVRRASPNSVAHLDAAVARAGQAPLHLVTRPRTHLEEELAHLRCLIVVPREFIAFLHHNSSVFPCGSTDEPQLRAVLEMDFRSAPGSVRSLLRRCGLPNVKHQDAARAGESCKGVESTSPLVIRQQIVEHAPSNHGIKRSGDGGFTEVCDNSRCVGAALTRDRDQRLRGVEQGDVVPAFDQCGSVSPCATTSVQHLCGAESRGPQ